MLHYVFAIRNNASFRWLCRKRCTKASSAKRFDISTLPPQRSNLNKKFVPSTIERGKWLMVDRINISWVRAPGWIVFRICDVRKKGPPRLGAINMAECIWYAIFYRNKSLIIDVLYYDENARTPCRNVIADDCICTWVSTLFSCNNNLFMFLKQPNYFNRLFLVCNEW